MVCGGMGERGEGAGRTQIAFNVGGVCSSVGARPALRMLAATIVLGTAALSMVPPVAAQNQPVFQISATTDGSKVIAEDLGTAVIRITVIMRTTQQFPGQDQFDIRLTATTLRNPQYPNGWSVSDPDPPTAQTRAGRAVNFTVTVTLTSTEPSAESIAARVRIQSTPQGPGGGSLPPGTPAGAQTEDTEDVSVEVARDLEPAEQVTTFVERNKWYLLAAAGGIFVLGVVLVRRKKGGFSVRSDSPVQEVLPGRGASFPIEISNESGTKRSLSLSASAVPPGWSAILPLERLELGGNESSTVWLTLKAPPTARPGEHIQASLVTTDADGNTVDVLVEAVVVEKYGVTAGARAPEAPREPLPATRRPKKPA